MLKRLGFFCGKELATEIRFVLPEHVTVDEVNSTCFLESVTTRELIYLTVVPAKYKCSMLVTYQKNHLAGHMLNLSGHMFTMPRLLEQEPKVKVLGRDIPNQFLVNEKTLHDHLTMVLSETSLSSSTQKRLATCLPSLQAKESIARKYRKGFMIEVDIRVVVDRIVHTGYGCKGREACPRRAISDRHVLTKVTGTDCAICLTELSGAVCRLELRCFHVFHAQCVLKWLERHTSCPVCRAKAVGETAFYY